MCLNERRSRDTLAVCEFMSNTDKVCKAFCKIRAIHGVEFKNACCRALSLPPLSIKRVQAKLSFVSWFLMGELQYLRINHIADLTKIFFMFSYMV